MPHIRIGDKLVEVERNENGMPVIKARAEEIKRKNGRVDVIVHVPCLQIQGKSQNQD